MADPDFISVRASSLAELFDCPARWEAKNLLNMKMPAAGAARLGTAIHASTSVFDESNILGSQITIDEAAGALVDAIHKPDEDVEWGEITPKKAEKIGLSLHSLYCTNIAPQQNYVGVEVRCEALTITDIGLVLTGTTDRIRQLPDGSIGIVDLKSGGTAVSASGKANTKGHAPQLAVYELLAEFAFGQPITAPAQIVGLNTGKTPTTQRVATAEIENVREALIGDADEDGMLTHASKIIHSGSFYGNPKSVLCSEKYCPRYKICKFKG